MIKAKVYLLITFLSFKIFNLEDSLDSSHYQASSAKGGLNLYGKNANGYDDYQYKDSNYSSLYSDSQKLQSLNEKELSNTVISLINQINKTKDYIIKLN